MRYFWKRSTKQAATVTFSAGLIIGILMFSLDFPDANGIKLITNTWGINFGMQAWRAFLLCCVVFVLVSLLTPVPKLEQQGHGIIIQNILRRLKVLSIIE